MTGRSIIVTGGFGVVGRAVAQAFTAGNDRVARVDFERIAPDSNAAMDIGGVDIADASVAEMVVDQVTKAIGEPTILVNIAGGFIWETLADGGSASFERLFRMNALTAVSMSKAILPTLRAADAGAIINVGAGAAIRAETGMGAYAASKSAVHRLTESLAAETNGSGITVNAILPSIIDTPANRLSMPGADRTDWLDPMAVAEVILFLASRSARAISGALIPLSRGSGQRI